MSKASTRAHLRFNNKTYKQFNVRLKFDLYDDVEKLLKEKEISKAEFVRQAIKKFEDEKES